MQLESLWRVRASCQDGMTDGSWWSSADLACQRGTTLIEVLVALLLLSGGMLSMSLFHANSVKYTKMAHFRGIGAQVGSELAERMRANRRGVIANNYAYTATYSSTATAVAVPTCSVAAVCTPAELASIDLAEIRNSLRLILPGGGLRVTQDASATNVMNIWVIWLDPDSTGGDTAVLTCPFTATPAPQCLPMRVAL